MSETHRRKIQLVGGVTYSVSLPKKWALRNNLKDKNEVILTEKSDGSLLVSKEGISSEKDKRLESFHVDIDHYKEDISQILFSLYYLGTERMTIFSKKPLDAETKAKIKSIVRYMIGTEVVEENDRRISIAVLLDKNRVDTIQLFYRISLLINTMIDSILTGPDPGELHHNEEEIDRLYHLLAKIIFLAHSDTGILRSSGIGNSRYLTPYLLISKKLENIGDSIYRLGLHLSGLKKPSPSVAQYLEVIRTDLNNGIRFLMAKERKSFTSLDKSRILGLQQKVRELRDVQTITQLDDSLRYLLDVQEELTTISFFSKLASENIL